MKKINNLINYLNNNGFEKEAASLSGLHKKAALPALALLTPAVVAKFGMSVGVSLWIIKKIFDFSRAYNGSYDERYYEELKNHVNEEYQKEYGSNSSVLGDFWDWFKTSVLRAPSSKPRELFDSENEDEGGKKIHILAFKIKLDVDETLSEDYSPKEDPEGFKKMRGDLSRMGDYTMFNAIKRLSHLIRGAGIYLPIVRNKSETWRPGSVYMNDYDIDKTFLIAFPTKAEKDRAVSFIRKIINTPNEFWNLDLPQAKALLSFVKDQRIKYTGSTGSLGDLDRAMRIEAVSLCNQHKGVKYVLYDYTRTQYGEDRADIFLIGLSETPIVTSGSCTYRR